MYINDIRDIYKGQLIAELITNEINSRYFSCNYDCIARAFYLYYEDKRIARLFKFDFPDVMPQESVDEYIKRKELTLPKYKSEIINNNTDNYSYILKFVNDSRIFFEEEQLIYLTTSTLYWVLCRIVTINEETIVVYYDNKESDINIKDIVSIKVF